MKLKKKISLFLIPLTALLLMATLPTGSLNRGAQRTVEFTYAINLKDIPSGTKKLQMWIPAPPTDADQTILATQLNSPYPVSIFHDQEWGNKMLFIETDRPEDFTFTATYTILRKERAMNGPNVKEEGSGLIDNEQLALYMRPSKMGVINEAVRKMTRVAMGEKTEPIEKARAIYDYIIDNMRYDKSIPGWGQGDVQRICLTIGEGERGTGNCTDFHSLFESMMRVAGIPVRFEMGYPLNPEGEQRKPKKGGYHCWAQFFIADVGWIPVDISEASKDRSKRDYYFGTICENRIRFSRGRDITLSPRQKGAPLNYFGPDPYVEVDGKPFTSFTRTVAYRAL